MPERDPRMAGQTTTNAPALPGTRRAPARFGYLHVGPDWRVTATHLADGSAADAAGVPLAGQVLWDLFPLLGTPFEQAYRATMADRQPRTFSADYLPDGRRVEVGGFPAGQGIAIIYDDLMRRDVVEAQLRRREAQQAAVARLGLAALEGGPGGLQSLLDQAAREVAAGLQTEFSKFVQVEPDGETLRLRAGVGWRPGIVGKATMAMDEHSQSGYVLQAHGPVIVEDLPTDPRFAAPPLLLEHGVVSGMSVLVGPRDRPLGVLGAHTTQHRTFTQDDLNFLQAVANLLAAAMTRHRVQEELRRHRADLETVVSERTRLLEDTNRELEAFSYSVSHDLRTPLRAIDGFSNLLQQQYGALLPPEGQGLLERVREGAQRMGHLIESLLGLARIGRRDLTPTTVDVTQVARDVLAELQAGEPGRSVQAEVQPGMVALADPDLVRILLDNLLGNAWKFSARRSKARIEVGRDAEAFFVRDNGAGFDLAHAGRLFEPFQRLHNDAEFEGTGIGLAIVARIVARHHGRVWADSRPGKGATFHFTLGSA